MSKKTEHEGLAVLRSRLGAICAASHDAIVGLSPAGVVETWNPAAAELYGYTAEEIIGSQGEVLVAPERRGCGERGVVQRYQRRARRGVRR
jgi:PAS domain S-box-containing protein